MSAHQFIEDLRRARQELDAATAEVMALVNTSKAFGERWHAAVDRERRAHQTLRGLMDTSLVFSQNRPTGRGNPTIHSFVHKPD
jgi:hypothetical protein